MKDVILLPEQSLFDISIQEYGSLDKVFDLAEENDVSITDECEAGTILKCNTDSKSNVVNYLDVKGIKPVTGTSNSISSKLGGIGYMSIGVDFIVS
ncbi:MAG: hypothetical protein COC06_07515 [Bacteroidales bacterium]|nr:MAG: hypothetical protein COC06_07515 [Bacteroidales bacterium]